MTGSTGSHEQVNVAMDNFGASRPNEKKEFDASEIERVMTPDELQKDKQDYGRIDVRQDHCARSERQY